MGTYQFNPVDVGNYTGGTHILSGSEAFPSVSRYGLMSGWWRLDDVSQGFYYSAGTTNLVGFYLQMGSGGLSGIPVGQAELWISGTPSGAGSKIMFDVSSIVTGTFYNVLASFDAVGNIAQLYVNDIAAPTISASWISSEVPWSAGSDFCRFGGASTGVNVCAGDIYLRTTESFFDLSVVANRRKFIDANAKPVSLGTDGSLPTGTPPQVFLHVDGLSSNPNDMLINRGNGGADFTFQQASGALVLCASGVFPFVPAKAGLADLWFGSTGAFFDLSVETNRRKLISASGCPVDLLADGSGVTGAPPPVYFSVRTGGTADSFAANKGSGGTFTLSGGDLTFEATKPCGDVVSGYIEGGNVPQGADPQVMLSVSDDGGRTWSPLQKWRSMGKLGEYTKRLRWLKMGQFRQRVIKLEITDPVRRRLIGFYEDVSEGME